jgi:hypothetical protein
MMKRIFNLLAIAVIISSCGNQVNPDNLDKDEEVGVEGKNMTDYTKEDISRYTIAAIMGRDPSIIDVKQQDDIYIVSYVRPSDGTYWESKIKFEGEDKVIWGNSDGRWRDTEADEKITYFQRGDKLVILQTFSDNSKIEKEYSKPKKAEPVF